MGPVAAALAGARAVSCSSGAQDPPSGTDGGAPREGVNRINAGYTTYIPVTANRYRGFELSMAMGGGILGGKELFALATPERL